ncbi:hypothetical protein BY996DRAFT_6426388 [Phakopsora pachyrhizi]|nr:hypothetical protein BY996DRAFT_6426388 [Phakopsora pachyrhizi]
MTNPPGNLKLAMSLSVLFLVIVLIVGKRFGELYQWIILLLALSISMPIANGSTAPISKAGGKEMEQLPMAHSFDFIGEEVTILAANIENFLTSMAKITRITISKTGKIVT